MSGVGTSNPFALLGDPSDPKPVKKTDKGSKAPTNKGRGGRGGRSGGNSKKREFDRRSGTGRGKEISKKGHGKGGWGKAGEEYALNGDDDQPRGGRGRGRGGRGRGRRGRGNKGKGRGQKTNEKAAAEAGEKKENAPEGEQIDDLELYEEEEEEEPDNFTLDEWESQQKTLDNDNLQARVVEANDKFGKVTLKESKADVVSKKAKQKKKKRAGVIDLGSFNQTFKASAKKQGRGAGQGQRRGNRNNGGRGRRGRGAGGRGRGAGGRGRGAGGRARRGNTPRTDAQDEFPSL